MVRIERALTEDVEKLTQVGIQAFAEDAEKYGASPSGVDQVENHREWIEKYHYYKIVIGNEIVGGIIVMPGDECYTLGALFIAPIFQNQGHGSRGIKFIEEKYPTATKWALCTPYRNDRLHRFYEKLGYEKVGETKPGEYPEVPDKNYVLWLYEKKMRDQNERTI